jgi:hypothetical protein
VCAGEAARECMRDPDDHCGVRLWWKSACSIWMPAQRSSVVNDHASVYSRA